MPRIRDNIRDCAAYLYPSAAAAKSGATPGGSAFLVGIPSKADQHWCYPYVVANRSVVAGGSTVVRLNTHAGETDIIELSADDWVVQPLGDDLAVAPVQLHSDYHNYMLVIDPDMFLTQDWMQTARIGLGDELFLVGRLIDHEGRQQNTPVVRCGQIAMMPAEPIRQSNGQFHECFLADVQAIGGLTGSPVFVTVHRLRLQNPLDFNHAWSPYLLGINCGMHAHSGLMMVLPAWRLADLLNQPQLLVARIDEDSRRRAGGSRLRAGR